MKSAVGRRVLFVGIGGDDFTKDLISDLRSSGALSFAAGVIDEQQVAGHNFDEIVCTFRQALFANYSLETLDNLFVDDDLYAAIGLHEGQLLRQMDRLEYEVVSDGISVPFDGSFEQRRRLLFRHLCFWDHALTFYGINAVVFHNVPHQIFDFVAYLLCKNRRIPTLIFNQIGAIQRTQFVAESIEGLGGLDFGLRLKAECRFLPEEELGRIHNDWTRISNHVSQNRESAGQVIPKTKFSFIEALTLHGHIGRSTTSRFRQLIALTARIRKLFRHPTTALSGWNRTAKRIKAVTESRRQELIHVSTGPLPDHFLYFPLHFQPEATTAAKGRHFVELREAVAFVASAIPPEFMLVIKEHPHQYQKLLPRPQNFMSSLAKIDKVHIVDSSIDSSVLRDRCHGIVTVTGSNGFEVLATGKGVIALGMAAWREAPGVWTVKDRQELEVAVADLCYGRRRNPSEYLPFLNQLVDSTFEGELSGTPSNWSQEQISVMGTRTRLGIGQAIGVWLNQLDQQN